MRRTVLTVLLAFLCLPAKPSRAAELKQKTVEAFDHYIRATEARMAEELNPLLKKLPRETLSSLLTSTRAAVTKKFVKASLAS